MTTIALFGAGGSMGMRVVRALKDDPEYRLLCVEPSEAGQARVREAGLERSRRRRPPRMPMC